MSCEACEHVTRRLDAMAREHRRFRRTVAGAALLALPMLLVGQVRAKGRVVEGEVFVLKDAKNVARGGLRVNESGAAELTLFSGRGNAAVLIVADPSGRQAVGLVDDNGQGRANLALNPDGAVVLGLSDASGTPRLGMSLHREGVPVVTLAGSGGTSAILGALPNGEAALTLVGKDKQPRVAVAIDASGAASLKLFKDGKPIFAKP